MTEDELRELLTDEFLETLVAAVRVCGWDVDLFESAHFANWCFEVAGKEERYVMEPCE